MLPYRWEAFCWHGLGPLVPLEGRVTANQYKVVLSDHLYPMMKHFYPDGSGLFQDDNAPVHRARGVTEWFDEYENDVNHMLWPSQSPDFNPIEHLWEILDWRVRQRSPPPSSKRQMREYVLEEWCCRINTKAHWSCSGSMLRSNTLLRHFMLFFSFSLSPVCSFCQFFFEWT